MSTLRRIALTAPAALALVLGMSACSFSASLTVSPDTVADAAADALEAEVGVRPEMDCGDEAIALEDGASVPCTLTDPSTGTKFDTDVTLHRDGDSNDFSVTAVVADTPQAG